MFWQKEYIRENVAMTLNDTYRVDLPENGNLGSLILRISGSQVQNQGINGGAWRILDYISKIELIGDGSTIIKSLRGDMVQACAFYDDGCVAPDRWMNYASGTQRAFFVLNLGRFLHDPLLGLILEKFKNVELRITNTATATLFSDLTVSVLGVYQRESAGAGFIGYLRTEEWRSWTTIADQTQYLDIPTENDLRRVILQAIPNVDANNVETTGIENLMDDIEYTLDSGMVRMFKGGIDDMIRWNAFEYKGLIVTGGEQYMNADRGVRVGLGYVTGGAWGAGSRDGAGAAIIATMESGRTSFTQKPETFEADNPMQFLSQGISYHNTAVLKHDHDPEPSSWLSPEERKTVEINIHTRNLAAAADGTNRVILDRLVSY